VDSGGCRITETAEGLEVPRHVQPRARRTELVGIHTGALKLKISAPPVDDAATCELPVTKVFILPCYS
jgi:hypothetical protein